MSRHALSKKHDSLKKIQFVTRGVVCSGTVEGTKFTNERYRYTNVSELLKVGERIVRENPHEAQERPGQKNYGFAAGLFRVIQDLRDEIKMLEMQHIRISAAIPAADGAWNTVMGYFRVVRHRLPLSLDLLQFVSKTMAANVLYNSEYGIEAMIRSWYFLQWFGDVREELENLSKTAKHSMVATTRISVTITKQTLVNVFPHLLRDDDVALRNKLLGQRIVMRGSTCFEWGDANERVTSVIAQSDMLTPMLHLLGNWEDVSWVFERAIISPDFQWRSMCTA
ncbi:hypothetical protein PHMEG_00020591 [Phytophthora megakarya]|uniref:Uncharacterized protein n=1 Tax=Phytophthora megakarya TaxID=4795 RepID=A0A225VQA1_9STRA|nr:hypothetical protein PHMEG_00020591 [Phytophthora megakarya]